MKPGELLAGRYRILSVLGKGGMGAVYLCEDINEPSLRWAVKELLPDPMLAETEQNTCREMFSREAEFLGKLSHPNRVNGNSVNGHRNVVNG